MTFVNKVNEKKYSDNKDIRTTVTEAVDECIASGILSDSNNLLLVNRGWKYMPRHVYGKHIFSSPFISITEYVK